MDTYQEPVDHVEIPLLIDTTSLVAVQ
jgi:hypothetical protein